MTAVMAATADTAPAIGTHARGRRVQVARIDARGLVHITTAELHREYRTGAAPQLGPDIVTVETIGAVDPEDPDAWQHMLRLLAAHGYRRTGEWFCYARRPCCPVRRDRD